MTTDKGEKAQSSIESIRRRNGLIFNREHYGEMHGSILNRELDTERVKDKGSSMSRELDKER